ncbi:MAG TPA: ABC transporter permease [Candidatus Polarisedimenticolia bacterium]|jgi:peptide/nickel transport system permease protein
MAGYLGRRLLLSAATMLLITAGVYAAIRLAPGIPGPDDETARAAPGGWIDAYHIQDSIPVGYARWIADLARLDFGRSLGVAPGRPVADLVESALPYTLLLGSMGFALTWMVALPLGILGAWIPRSPGARVSAALLFCLHALPAFWIALALQQVVAGRLGALPAVGPGPLEARAGMTGLMACVPYWVLPTVALTTGSLAFVIRFCRSVLLEAASHEYVATARAKGAGPARVLCRHALGASAVPLVSLTGLMLPGILSGSVVIETIFGLPGIGRLLFRAAGQRDYPVIMAVSLMAAAATVGAHLLTDLIAGAADPRFKAASGGGREGLP